MRTRGLGRAPQAAAPSSAVGGGAPSEAGRSDAPADRPHPTRPRRRARRGAPGTTFAADIVSPGTARSGSPRTQRGGSPRAAGSTSPSTSWTLILALVAAGCLALAGCTGGTPPAAGPGGPGTAGAGGPATAAPTGGPGTGPAPGTAAPGAGPGTGTPEPPPAAAGGPVAGAPVVVLDAGHNGGNTAHRAEIARPVPDGRGGTKPCNTTGTATAAGYPEHAFNFDVAQRTERLLEAAGVRVVLTRPDDSGVGPCVDVRGTAGQRANAAAVVAIHADGAAPSGSGFHVALASPPLNPAQAGPARALGAALHDALRGAGFHESTYLGERGISLRPDLAGLNLATRPAALVECANMRNPGDAAVVSSADGRQRYATALAAGIIAYLRHP